MSAITEIHTRGLPNRRAAKKMRAGVTLLEIMIALSLLVILAVGFLYSAMSTVRLNRLTELEVSATNAITSQLDVILAASRDNQLVSGSVPNGALYYIDSVYKAKEKRSTPSGFSPDDYPIRMDLRSNGVLVYEFPVAYPGYVSGEVTSVDKNLMQTQHELARGVMLIYLKEQSVPSSFYGWNDVTESGGETSSNITYFDMNNDDKSNGDFTALFNAANTSVFTEEDYKINSLPVTVVIRYYNNAEALNNDTNGVDAGFVDGADASYFSLSRNYILNNSAGFRPAG